MWIMISGPYGTGAGSAADCERNRRRLNEAALAVFRKGHVPVLGLELALPMVECAGSDHYEAIVLPLCLALAERCDAVLRVDGDSDGADREVERVVRHGGVVYRSLDDIPPGLARSDT